MPLTLPCESEEKIEMIKKCVSLVTNLEYCFCLFHLLTGSVGSRYIPLRSRTFQSSIGAVEFLFVDKNHDANPNPNLFTWWNLPGWN